MQARAIFEGSCRSWPKEGTTVLPRKYDSVGGYLSKSCRKLRRRSLSDVAKGQLMKETGVEFEYRVGTMIEIPSGMLGG